MIDNETIAKEIAFKASQDNAHDVALLELGQDVVFTDYFLLLTVDSIRQLKAIVEDLTYEFNKLSESKVRIEGSAESGWVLLDCEWLIIHIFINESREFYRLDEFWINSREIIRIL